MKCVECSKEVTENTGTDDNPLCRECYERMAKEHSTDANTKQKAKKPAWMPVFLLIVVLLLAAGVGGYFLVRSPKFALHSIASAIDNHDWDKFTRFVDVESIYSTTVKDAFSNTDNAIAQGLGTMLASNMKETFIDQLKTQIEQTKKGNSSMFHQIFGDDDFLISKMTVENKGKIVQARIPRRTQYLDAEVPINFNFRKGTLFLKLTSIDMSAFEKAENKIEEILSDYYNLPICDSLAKLVTLETIRKYKGCSNRIGSYCYDDLLMITTRVTNKSDRNIASVNFEIFPGEHLLGSSTKKYQDAKNIQAGKSVLTGTRQGWKYNQFDNDDKVFMNCEKSDICYKVTEIEFEDGSKIEENKYAYISRYPEDKPTLEDVLERRKQYGLADEMAIRRILAGENSE